MPVEVADGCHDVTDDVAVLHRDEVETVWRRRKRPGPADDGDLLIAVVSPAAEGRPDHCEDRVAVAVAAWSDFHGRHVHRTTITQSDRAGPSASAIGTSGAWPARRQTATIRVVLERLLGQGRPTTSDDPGSAGPPLPTPVVRRLQPGEQPIVAIAGAQGSGIVLTDRRLIRWRPPGAIATITIAAVGSIDLRRATAEHPALLTFVAADAGAPLAVGLDERHVPAALDALQVIVGTIHQAHRTRLHTLVDVATARTSSRTTWRFNLGAAQRPARRLLSTPRAPRA
jgi:hypothetical protein